MMLNLKKTWYKIEGKYGFKSKELGILQIKPTLKKF